MISRVPAQRLADPGLVIIPARDEAGSVGDVVRDVKNHLDWEVVVVDDASSDDTKMIAEGAGARVVRMPYRVGAWGALQTGMAYALHTGYEICLTMDADGQHIAEELPAVCAPVIQGVSDVAIGVCPERVSRARYLAWSFFKRITGLNIQDVTSGLRVYNVQAMQVLTNKEAAMLNYQDIGVLLMLREAGLQAAEVKVRMQERRNGHSRVYDSWWTVARYLMETAVLSTGKWRPSWHLDDMFITSARDGDK